MRLRPRPVTLSSAPPTSDLPNRTQGRSGPGMRGLVVRSTFVSCQRAGPALHGGRDHRARRRIFVLLHVLPSEPQPCRAWLRRDVKPRRMPAVLSAGAQRAANKLTLVRHRAPRPIPHPTSKVERGWLFSAKSDFAAPASDVALRCHQQTNCDESQIKADPHQQDNPKVRHYPGSPSQLGFPNHQFQILN